MQVRLLGKGREGGKKKKCLLSAVLFFSKFSVGREKQKRVIQISAGRRLRKYASLVYSNTAEVDISCFLCLEDISQGCNL